MRSPAAYNIRGAYNIRSAAGRDWPGSEDGTSIQRCSVRFRPFKRCAGPASTSDGPDLGSSRGTVTVARICPVARSYLLILHVELHMNCRPQQCSCTWCREQQLRTQCGQPCSSKAARRCAQTPTCTPTEASLCLSAVAVSLATATHPLFLRPPHHL